jgi:hypothetical protein
MSMMLRVVAWERERPRMSGADVAVGDEAVVFKISKLVNW